MKKAVEGLIQNDVRSACTKDTLLHLCVSRLNVIKSGYFSDGTSLIVSQIMIFADGWRVHFLFSIKSTECFRTWLL